MERLTDKQTDRQTNGKETTLRTDTDVDFRLCVFVRFPIRLVWINLYNCKSDGTVPETALIHQ